MKKKKEIKEDKEDEEDEEDEGDLIINHEPEQYTAQDFQLPKPWFSSDTERNVISIKFNENDYQNLNNFFREKVFKWK